VELSLLGTFIPRNLRSLELSSPRVKFTWNFRSGTLKIIILYKLNTSRRHRNLIVYLLRCRPTLMSDVSKAKLTCSGQISTAPRAGVL